MHRILWFLALIPWLCVGQQAGKRMEFADPQFSRAWGQMPHILIVAHRGGVVTPQTPECSPGALMKAIEARYDGVELDLQESSDHVPFVFHDRDLKKAAGVDATIASLPSQKLEQIQFLGTEDTLMPFTTAARLARGKLQVMIEIKGSHSEQFYATVLRALEENGLTPYTFVFPNNPETKRVFGGKVRLILNHGDVPKLLPSLPDAGQKYFVFGLAVDLKKLPMAELRATGVPIIPAINTFRYPAAEHMKLAEQEIIEMLELGVDGFQIDSVYEQELRQAIRTSRKK